MVDRWTANGKNGGGASPAQSGTRRAELSDADMTMVCIWVCTSLTSSTTTTTTTTTTTGKTVAEERDND